MIREMSNELREVLDAVHYRPAVSILIPFEPKMNVKSEIAHSLKIAAAAVQDELNEKYPGETGRMVMHKLAAIINGLNFNTHKKSIAIYVSPVFEKVLYLDIAVEKKIIVDESFEIRDLVFSKKQFHKYLVLLLSGKESRMYLGDTENFVRIISNSSKSVDAYINDAPEKVGNFSDMQARKEILMEKFLHHIDTSLDIILHAYHLPLFVLGTSRILGHFKKITKHQGAVIEYIQGNYEKSTLPELYTVLEPYIVDWKKVKEKDLLNQLEDAANKKKLATGMRDVWKQAMNNHGKLLVVEKNYMYAAQHGGTQDVIYSQSADSSSYSYIKDAVDDVMEKVFENGGDVEFVEDSVLAHYNHIALVQFY